jgi:hypothetical protein
MKKYYISFDTETIKSRDYLEYHLKTYLDAKNISIKEEHSK